MKHILLSILLTFASALTCQGQMVTLQHNGKIIGTFNSDAKTCLSEAFEHAEDGDTLYLSEGRYFNPPIIDKSIAIIGAGASLCSIFAKEDGFYGNSNTIQILPKENRTIPNITIEGVTIGNQLYLGYNYADKVREIENIIVNKAVIYGLSTSNIEIENATFESCKVLNSMYIQAKYLTFRNCEINDCYAGGSTMTLPKFLNCDILNLESSATLCINCIIGQVEAGLTSFLDERSILINTLYHKLESYDPAKKCLVQDCYATEKELVEDGEYRYSKKLIRVR